MKKLITLGSLLLLAFQVAQAQYFIDPSVTMRFKGQGTVTLTNGEVIEGTLGGYSMKKGLVKKLWVTSMDGEKLKLKGDQIQAFAFPPSEYSKVVSAVNGATNITRLGNGASIDEVLDRDMIYFEQGTIPGRKPLDLMMQLINPGFDSKIKVYHNPRGETNVGTSVGGIPVSATIVKSYYVKKDGVVMLIERKQYDEQFMELFGDCPELLEAYPNPKWGDFAEHVFYYDQGCN